MVQKQLGDILLQFWILKGSSGNHGNKRRVKEKKKGGQTERWALYEAVNRGHLTVKEMEWPKKQKTKKGEMKQGGGGEGVGV